MEADTSKDDVMNGSTNSKDSEEDESFVTKVRTKVSGLFSSSLSRIFKNQQSGVVRPRSTEDDESNESQPPCKKARGMENDAGSSLRYNENTLSDVMGNLNNEPRIENSFQSIPGPSFITKKIPQGSVNNTSTPYGSVNREKYVTSECTSGYSSMTKLSEGQNVLESNRMSERTIKPSEKTLSERKSLFSSLTLETPSRSLFADTSTSPQDKNTSLSSRRPSFNTSNFGSPSFIDRTLTSSRIINSPFYKGSTIYGGASAYGRQLGINETRKQQLQNSFLVKPINKQSDVKSFTSLSKTARRILETLEQCSTPMSDVKKVPFPTRTNNNQGLFSKYVAANPYRKNTSSMSRELMVPSVSERLKMKQIQRLQDTTNEIRQIATSSNSNNEDYKVATDSQQKHTNKMKTKLTSVRSKAPAIELLDDIILNPVPLMIPENKRETFKIPEFNLGAPKENVKQITDNPEAENGKLEVLKNKINVDKVEVKSQIGKDFINKQNPLAPIESDNSKIKTNLSHSQYEKEVVLEYTFSKPLVIGDNSKSIIAINNFKFSEPLSKKLKISEHTTEIDKQKSLFEGIDKITNGNISSESESGDVKKSSDSLLEKFRPPQGTWECQTCLIRNKSDVSKCAACETPRVEKNPILKTETSNFGLQFAKKTDEWDCSTCFVRNKVQNTVCVACSTPKTVKFEANGFCPKSKPTSKEWECDTCWVRNKEEANKCVACESMRKTNTTKASGDVKCSVCLDTITGNEGKCTKCNKNSTNQVKFDFPSHLKPPSDSWECGTCLIRNKNDLKACAACETPRANQGLDIKTVDSIKKSDKWECPTCMVRNDAVVEKCPCCETAKPGVTLISKSNVNMFNFGVNKMQFNFGIPKDMQAGNASAEKSTEKSSAETSSTAPLFNFGLKPETKQDDKTSTQINTPVLSKLTESKSEMKPDSSSLPLLQKGEKEKQASFQFKASSAASDNKSLPVFKFGAPPSDAKNPVADNFKFTPPKPITNDNKIVPTALEGVEKVDNKIPSFVAPAPLQNDPSKPLFSFGSKDNNNSENQNSKPLFSFGSSSSSTQPGGFNFNPVKTGGALQPSVVPSFVSNAVQQLPNANQGSTTLKNGGFNFGNTTTGSSQAAMFSFGAAASNPAEASTLPKGGFDFSSAVKPTGGFNFSSPAPTFDAGTKPAFNFTGGSIPSFSANPSEGGGASQPVRKFKRAVRRTQR